MSHASLSPAELKPLLRGDTEHALIDVREQGQYFHRHLLYACCLPLSRLEVLIDALVPRRGTRVVICDEDGGERSRLAAARLAGLGYDAIAVLEGGVDGWAAAGYELFSGINVPSKAFGEIVELRQGTPHLSAGELARKLDAGEKLVILDSRPFEEFHNMSIPGGVDCPGAELVYRVFEAAPEPDTLVVVNCAGRTRSIIGAQSLINAGVPNPVVALKDGTMGWTLAGFEVDRGCSDRAPAPSEPAYRKALAAAEGVAERFSVGAVDHQTLADWRADPERTVYLLDVRTPEEYRAGHLSGSRSAPGGQLVQATDEYIATRNARVVLVDDRRVRALMTASWLKQLGWAHTFVLREPLQGQTLEYGDAPGWQPETAAAPVVTAAELRRRLDGERPPAVLDLDTSLGYRRGHIPGAYWGLRSRLGQLVEAFAEVPALVISAPHDGLAQLTAAELQRELRDLDIAVLSGGKAAWREAGYPLASDDERLIGDADDVWYKPYEHREAVRQAMQDYLTWEVNLVEQIERDGDASFAHRP